MNNTGDKISLVEGYLKQSCAIYREIEKRYEMLMTSISIENPAPAEHVMASLNTLLDEAQCTDAAIAEALACRPPLEESTELLIQHRNDILYQLQHSNQMLVKKAKNIQALIRHELIGMANNRNALNGYKPLGTANSSTISRLF